MQNPPKEQTTLQEMSLGQMHCEWDEPQVGLVRRRKESQVQALFQEER